MTYIEDQITFMANAENHLIPRSSHAFSCRCFDECRQRSVVTCWILFILLMQRCATTNWIFHVFSTRLTTKLKTSMISLHGLAFGFPAMDWRWAQRGLWLFTSKLYSFTDLNFNRTCIKIKPSEMAALSSWMFFFFFMENIWISNGANASFFFYLSYFLVYLF